MKKKLLLLFIALSIFGCKSISYVQVFETKTNNVKTVDETYLFENDSLTITYNLWRERGLMQFTIYNKLNVPLYIDWRKSSYIDNAVKLNYWEDVERTNAIYASYSYAGSPYTAGSIGSSSTAMIKEERITFIPPKAKYTRSQFYIIPKSFTVLDKKGPYKDVLLKEDSQKTTKVYYKEFSKDETPRAFRNFLTFSLTEDFTQEFYVDNEFYISKILEMERRNFYGNRARYTRPKEGSEVLPFKDDRYFYVNVGERREAKRVKKVIKVDFDD